MRVLNRLLVASVTTALVAFAFAAVPATPAQAARGINKVNVGNTTVTEGGIAHVTVSLENRPLPSETISATVSTADDTARAPGDYVPESHDVTFKCADNGFNCTTSQTFDITTKDDNTREPTERILVVLSNVRNADQGTNGSVTVNDNETGAIPTFSINPPAAAPEGNADNNRAVQVTLSPASNQEVTLYYATADGTATASAAQGNVPDYTPFTTRVLHWPAGKTGLPTEGAVITQVKGDTLPEPDETYFVNFGGPNNAVLPVTQAPIQLNNDDGTPPAVSLTAAPPKQEGNTGTSDQLVTINVSMPAPQAITVEYTTADGTAVVKDDYTETKGSVIISKGLSSKTVAVPIVGDTAAEPNETYTFTITKATNAVLGSPTSVENQIVNDDFGAITTTPGAGRVADIKFFGPLGALLGGYPAYESAFLQGAHVARGDFFNAGGGLGPDGIDEVVVGPGPNSRPLVKIFNAIDGTLRASFLAYPQSFAGGVFVAAGNLDADKNNGDELVVAPGAGGGPHIRVLRVLGASTITDLSAGGFMAYDPGFRGGVHIAVDDLVGDTHDELVTAPAGNGGPHVKLWNINGQGGATTVSQFMAYGSNFMGGVWVAAAGKKLVTGAGPGGAPHVRSFTNGGTPDGPGFYAYGQDFHGGVRVGAGNLDDQLLDVEIVTGPGPGGAPHVRAFELDGRTPFGPGFYAYEPNFGGGVEVAIGQN